MNLKYEQFDVLHNFISPVTGRILADFNYVLVGDKNGIATPSPILIDIRLDLIALRKRYNTLVKGDIIIGHPNNELPNAQVLFNLPEGYLYNTEGIISTTPLIPISDLPDLPYQNIWIGDITNRPVPQQRVTLDNLPSFLSASPTNNLGLYNLYTGQFNVTSPTQVGQPSITQRIDMSNMPHLSKGKMLIGKINYIPPVITIDAIFPYVHVVGSLNWSAPGLPPGDGDAVPTEIGLDPGQIFIGDPANPGQIIASDIISPLLSLTYKRIWRGDINNRPIEVDDLTTLEGRVDILTTRISTAENAIIGLKTSLAQLGVEIGALQLQVGALDTALGLLTVEVQAIATSVGALTIAVTGIGLTVTALSTTVAVIKSQVNDLARRTLDQIPLAVVDVNLNGHKIFNLANPTNPSDAVNLQSMNAAIAAGAISSVTGTVNQIVANTVSGAVTLSLPTDVIISTSLTVANLSAVGNTILSTNTNGNIILNPNGTGNVDVNNHRIINLANPINSLDAVNLQTLNAAIGTGIINSVTGTTNQITANTVSGAVTLSLPNAVIISTLLQAGNMELIGNSIISTNVNGSISIAPDGTGNLLLIPSPSTGNVGIKGTPSFPLDVFGVTRTQRLIGNTTTGLPTITAGIATVTGTGSSVSKDGSELAGTITLTTGTGITVIGSTNPILNITLSSAMPTAFFSVVISAGSLTASALPLFVVRSGTSNFSIRCNSILSNSTVYTFYYHLIGNS